MIDFQRTQALFKCEIRSLFFFQLWLLIRWSFIDLNYVSWGQCICWIVMLGSFGLSVTHLIFLGSFGNVFLYWQSKPVIPIFYITNGFPISDGTVWNSIEFDQGICNKNFMKEVKKLTFLILSTFFSCG